MRALDRQTALQRPPAAKAPDAMPLAVLAQAKSSLGSGPGVLSAPPIRDAGRPLDSATRGSMESGFGRDFSSIRVHDDARAHDNARSLGARAYAAGDHIVFGEGQYRPESSSGQALIAHELAHSVQQGGVQMKADGPMPAAADAELEAQADRAATAVTAGRAAPALSRIGVPAIFRNPVGSEAPAAGPATKPNPGPTAGLPDGMRLVSPGPEVADPPNATIEVTGFQLPEVKGPGKWVQQAYDDHAKDKRLAFMPIFTGSSREPEQSMGAFKEGDEKYKTIWMAKYGFKSLANISTAFAEAAKTNPDIATLVKKPSVDAILKGFQSNKLTGAKCDIDHIVEKQLQGSSAPENLQLLGAEKNQTSGTNTFQALKALVHSLDATPYGRVQNLRLEFPKIAVKADGDAEDGSFFVEQALRDQKVKGSDEIAKNMKGDPVQLSAGSAPETVNILPTGETDIDFNAKRVVPGMRLKTYSRSKTKGDDSIQATLDHKVMKSTGEANQIINLVAKKAEAPAPDAASVPAAGGTAPGPAAGEFRKILLPAVKKGKPIGFYYPYLSKGEITELSLDNAGAMSGKGVIHPTPRFLGDLQIAFGPDTLALTQDINVDALNKSPLVKPLTSIFRFTSGSVELDLVNFIPKGKIDFSFGVAANPWMTGYLEVKRAGSALEATGELTPKKIPGVKDASGKVRYNSETGLSGELTATSSTFGGGTTAVDARLGFKEQGGRLVPFADGGMTINAKGGSLTLTAKWGEQGIEYGAKGRVPKPLPMVSHIDFTGDYKGGRLKIQGSTVISWKKIDNITLVVTYTRNEGDEEGKFGGSAAVKTTMGKAELDFTLGFDEAGKWWANGSIAYPVTPNIKPKLAVGVDKQGLVKVSGGVDIASIELVKKWPGPNGGDVKLLKEVGMKFPVPLPVPIPVTVFGEITASAGFNYSIGPLALVNVKFNGSLYPLEDDPKIEASLTGALSMPGQATLYGALGANIGVEIAAGAVGAKGGISLEPAITLTASAEAPFSATYKEGAFSFFGEAKAKGKAELSLGINLNAKVYAAYGIFSHDWKHKLADYKWPLGSEMQLYMGSIRYGKEGVKWPSLSEMKITPEVDPMGMVKKLMGDAKDKARETSEQEKAADAEMRREIARMNRGPKW